MNVVIQKSSDENGAEKFNLVNQDTGNVITKKPVSEQTLRNYLKGIGEPQNLIDESLDKARARFEKKLAKDEGSDTVEVEDIFSEIALDASSGSDVF